MIGDESKSSIGDTDRSLVRRAQEHDRDALLQLIAWYTPLLWHWLRRCGLPRSEQEGIAQDVHLKVISRLGQYGRGKFRAWLRTILMHELVDYWRAKQRQNQADRAGCRSEVEPWQTLGEGEEDTERLILLRQALELIRKEVQVKTFQAFWRTEVDGCKAPEAAAELGMTAKSVRMARARVLKRLRSHFQDLL